MTTPETRQSELKGFIAMQKEIGGVQPSKLKDGTKILIETRDYIYQLAVNETGVGRRYFLDTASPNCRDEHVCIGITSHITKFKYDMTDWIGKDLRLLLTFTSGRAVMTGEVQGVSISGQRKDGSHYHFELWGETNVE